jgi:catechol 2,3-dioxygenase-like lactoylglutathione lyase family enzyme
MRITAVVPQLRTANLAESIRFYTTQLGGRLEFEHEDFYAGIRLGDQLIHLKLVDAPDPSIAFVREGEHLHLYLETDDVAAVAKSLEHNGVRLTQPVHDTAWGTRECAVEDDQGHTLYFGERA